jgi:hypothetical protein
MKIGANEEGGQKSQKPCQLAMKKFREYEAIFLLVYSLFLSSK